MSKASEVEWGEASEEKILRRWVKLSAFSKEAKGYHKTPAFCDFDFYVYDEAGFIICYVEVKRRRTEFSKYGDAMFPMRKHKRARQSAVKFNLPVIGVTEYGCGALVEVNLGKEPARKKDVSRRDRPGMRPVPHAFYTKRQLTLLESGD